MHLLLDAHVSGRRLAAPLRKSGHDVRAVNEDQDLDGFTDESLLQLATEEGRVLITFDVKDFPDIARRWAEADRSHAGLAIVVGIDHSEFGTVLEALHRLFEDRGDQARWESFTCFVSRAAAGSSRSEQN